MLLNCFLPCFPYYFPISSVWRFNFVIVSGMKCSDWHWVLRRKCVFLRIIFSDANVSEFHSGSDWTSPTVVNSVVYPYFISTYSQKLNVQNPCHPTFTQLPLYRIGERSQMKHMNKYLCPAICFGTSVLPGYSLTLPFSPSFFSPHFPLIFTDPLFEWSQSLLLFVLFLVSLYHFWSCHPHIVHT